MLSEAMFKQALSQMSYFVDQLSLEQRTVILKRLFTALEDSFHKGLERNPTRQENYEERETAATNAVLTILENYSPAVRFGAAIRVTRGVLTDSMCQVPHVFTPGGNPAQCELCTMAEGFENHKKK